MVDTVVIACIAAVIYAIQVCVSLYRESQYIKHRDEVIKAHRIRETELLNRLMAHTTQEYAMLNSQAAEVERSNFHGTEATVKEDKIQEYLEQAGIGPDGFSRDGVAVV